MTAEDQIDEYILAAFNLRGDGEQLTKDLEEIRAKARTKLLQIVEEAEKKGYWKGIKVMQEEPESDTAPAIAEIVREARQEELAKTCLGGMGGLTPDQQTYITKRLEELEAQE